MRRILSEEELAVKQKRRNTIISMLLLGIMLISTAGFAFVYNSENKQTGNGNSKVQQSGDRWIASFGGTTVGFSFSPESSLNNTKVGIIPNFNQFYNQPLYIDSNDSIILSEIASSLGQFTLRTQPGCYSNCENSSYVQKNCTDNMIIFNKNEKRSITGNQSCIFIDGDLSTVDAFLYKTFGLA